MPDVCIWQSNLRFSSASTVCELRVLNFVSFQYVNVMFLFAVVIHCIS